MNQVVFYSTNFKRRQVEKKNKCFVYNLLIFKTNRRHNESFLKRHLAEKLPEKLHKLNSRIPFSFINTLSWQNKHNWDSDSKSLSLQSVKAKSHKLITPVFSLQDRLEVSPLI